MNAKTKIAITITAAIIAFAPNVWAEGSNNAYVPVSASVNDNCVVSAGALDFGGYDPVDLNATEMLAGTATVTVRCTIGAEALVMLSASAGGQGEASPQNGMNSGANSLDYTLWQDASYSTVWGNSAATGVRLTGDGNEHDLTVYGKIPGGQNVPMGDYTDTVMVTVCF